MMATTPSRSILDVLKERPVIGDGSYLVILEKRGYVKVGPYTPEASIEHPDAVRELHREYLHAGADVIQAFTIYANESRFSTSGKEHKVKDLNNRACEIAAEARKQGNAFICGGLSPTNSYEDGKGKAAVQQEFRTQVEVFIENNCDFLLGEFFSHVEELEWAVEVMKEAKKPIAVTMRIGPVGDHSGVSVEECAIRMAKTGADIVGPQCQYDPNTNIKTLKRMKAALDKEGLRPFLMTQPLGFMAPETENTVAGYLALPEYPLALEPRLLTRMDARKFAREAYEAGARYIGGCCAFEPHHIREMADELKEERGFNSPSAANSDPFCASMLKNYHKDSLALASSAERVGRDYWLNIKPSSGRPDNPPRQSITSDLVAKKIQHKE